MSTKGSGPRPKEIVERKKKAELPTYWRWLLEGSGGKPGYTRIVNGWLLVHVLVGFASALFVPVGLASSANTVLLPLVGILVGLSFAWAGNAQALLQSSEIQDLSEYHEGGFVDYVFVYQTAIFAILVTLVLWGFAGLEVFDSLWPTPVCSKAYVIVKSLLFSLISLTLRECWHVVQGAHWMLLAQREIKKSRKEQKPEQP